MGIFSRKGGEKPPDRIDVSQAGKKEEYHEPADLPQWIKAIPVQGEATQEKEKAIKLYRSLSDLEQKLFAQVRQDTSRRFQSTAGKGMPVIFNPASWADNGPGKKLAEEYQKVEAVLARLRERYDLRNTFTAPKVEVSQPTEAARTEWFHLNTLFDRAADQRTTIAEIKHDVMIYLRGLIKELETSVNKLRDTVVQLRGLAVINGGDFTDEANKLRAVINRERVLANRDFTEVEERYEWRLASQDQRLFHLAEQDREVKVLMEGVNNAMEYWHNLKKKIETELGITEIDG